MMIKIHTYYFKWAMMILAHLFIVQTYAQSSPDTTKSTALVEVVVSGSKFIEKKKNIVQKIDNISSSYIKRVNAQNTGDLLMSTGNIFVQKSQQGGSSPVIRGFEASRILLIVDGIRMNNATYRSGHLQNVITIDQHTLENIEVLYGPASTLYGSDALGGAVHMITKRPILSDSSKKTLIKANGLMRYSTANQENTVHADVNIGGHKIAFLSSITLSRFGDLRMGKKDKSDFPGFGTRPFYIRAYDGNVGDSIMRNNNDRIQKYSGYSQLDLMQKVVFKTSAKLEQLINFQLSTSSNIPRYDRLQDIRDGNLRYAQWYYGPQQRTLLGYTLQLKDQPGFFGEYKAIVSHQTIEESRITRQYKRYDELDQRREKVDVIGLTIDARRKMRKDEITSGMDLQLNHVISTAHRTNLLNGLISPLDTRYPDGKNRMNHAAIYIQHIRKMNDGKIVLNDGIRYQYVFLNSSIINNSFFSLPVTDMVQRNGAITGNIGIAYMPSKNTRLTIGYSSGFRAPNIDDLSKIFESSTSARQVVVPNPSLRPESTNSIDIGVSQSIDKSISVDVGGFYTLFNNAIVKAPFTLNGQDSIIYYNTNAQVLASQNLGRAILYGTNASFTVHINNRWKFSSTANYTIGNLLTDNSATSAVYTPQQDGTYAITQQYVKRKPLDHIPPFFGKFSALYQGKKLYAECYIHVNGWKKLSRYNVDGEDNAQYATAMGSPAWQTVNLRFGIDLGPKLQLQLSLENLLDLNYRYVASGLSAPGRNFSFAIRGSL